MTEKSDKYEEFVAYDDFQEQEFDCAPIKDTGEQQEQEDYMYVASLYLSVTMCKGGRVIHQGYVCPHCDSNDPDTYCGAPLDSKEEYIKKLSEISAVHNFEEKL